MECMGLRDMGRPFDKHVDEQELETLASSYPYEDGGENSPPTVSVREAERHVAFCADCRRKVSQYRQLVDRMDVGAFAVDALRPDCPKDVDWDDVAAGLCPELKTQQLIRHAARCAHCGPLLRAATAADEPTAREEEFLAQLKTPSRPAVSGTRETPANHSSSLWPVRIWRQLIDWKILVPAAALVIFLAALGTGRRSSSPISGIQFAQFAAHTHEQHARGNLVLEVRADSQSTLNEWLHEKSGFSLALPGSSESPQGQLPFRIEGARQIEVGNKTAAYIAYQMQPDNVSLIVAPISAAVASGGVEAAFNKVTFHYYTIQNYKVVTWSVHGLTYALVSGEGNRTQRSCMVCHSAMRDRDLSRTPTPLSDQKNIRETFLQ